MKLFKEREIREAIAYAKEGGQALHVWMPRGYEKMPGVPKPFKKNKSLWAHLFDQNMGRLISTAKKLGVRKIKVGNEGHKAAHIDLCGAPLDKAIQQCENDANSL